MSLRLEPYLWHILVNLADKSQWRRRLQQKEKVDVVFISNFRDDAERQKYLIHSQIGSEFIDGFRINMGEVYSRLKIINTDTHELLTTKGRRKAKQQFLSATQWAVENGAKVVLLAASTKRLFGHDAKELKEKFPNVVFTIGDNGTAHLLLHDTLNAIKVENISKEHGIIAILGAYGILGEAMVEALTFRGYKVIAVGDNVTRQDAGNAYSKELTYVLGAFSYKKLSLSKGVVFGCFAEAMAIASMIKKDKYDARNWFGVNTSNIKIVADMFDKVGLNVPTPRSFGELV